MTTASTGTAPSRDLVFGFLRKEHIQRYSTIVVLALMFIIFSATVDRFLQPQNLLNIAQQISILTIVGVGLTFGLAAREIDLSVGFAVGLAGILVPLLLTNDVALPLALLAGIGAGLAIGIVNAALVTLIGIPSLIATLATASILFGISFLLTGGRAIYGGLPDAYLWLGQGRIGGFPVLALLMLLAVAVAWFVMERTIFGRYIYAVGGNRKAAELSGINVRLYRIAALVVCSVFAAVAGMLLASRLGSGQPKCRRALSSRRFGHRLHRHDDAAPGHGDGGRHLLRRLVHRHHQ